MSLLQRTYARLGVRSVAAATSHRKRTAATTAAATSVPSAIPTAPAKASPLTSSSQLWEAATQAFYVEYGRYTQNSSTVLRMTHAAELAMRRCLAEQRAAEALEVYGTLCRCGLIGITASIFPEENVHASTRYTSTGSLDRLAQEAIQHVPHRKRQHSVLALLMAAELDNASMSNEPLYPNEDGGGCDETSLQRPQQRSSERSTFSPSLLLPTMDNVSAAEQARIRICQRLHALHATGQLQQPLGKEYCLVEMQELCVSSTATSSSSRLRDEIEVGPLCALSRCVLGHPFAHTTPSASWAQCELQWEADMCSGGGGRWSTATSMASPRGAFASASLTPADALRLAQIDNVVSPYRALCRSTLRFLVSCVPDWDALFVRRVAETLVLPTDAHVVFPAHYHRSRTAARRCGGSGDDIEKLLDTARGVRPQPANTVSAWTDPSAHQLFGCHDVQDSGACRLPASPMARIEGMVKRRIHHDVVVPDTSYVVHHFHQLRQLARHREVVITHAVFVELADAASRMENPARFHVRRVLREVMDATTTATTAAAARELVRRERAGRSAGATLRKSPLAACGFTLLGLQDELALLERSPERFFLQESSEAACVQGSAGNGLFTLASASVSSSVSVVLVAKQLERMIAAHDRGEDFAREEGDSTEGALGNGYAAVSSNACGAQFDVTSLVSHLVGGPVSDSSVKGVNAATRVRAEPLFKNRSRGHWAQLPTLVATTSSSTRAAAFQVGLSMHPPASVAP